MQPVPRNALARFNSSLPLHQYAGASNKAAGCFYVPSPIDEGMTKADNASNHVRPLGITK